jgi:TolB-like protein
MPLQPGDKLGPYEILAPIGAGGMGEVYKARDTRLDRIVAIKQLKGLHSARFHQEGRAIAALNHPNKPSIAVLPFANIGKDQENEYFSDGLAEEIINFLTQIPGLKMTARTSAFAFKGKTEDIRKIADTLGVTTILEGSVRRSGSRLRVTAQLINAQDGYHLWSDKRGLVECGAGNSVRGLVPRGKAYLGERCGRSADRCRGDYCA